MRDMIKPTVSLFLICLMVSFSLAFVYGITKDTIAYRTEADAEKKRGEVHVEADSFQALEGWEDKDESGIIEEIYEAYSGNTLIGYVFSVAPKGFGGEIAITVGVSADNVVSGVRVGDNTETPGLGSKAADDDFTAQYAGMEITKEFVVVKGAAKNDNEIEAVSGATVSSNAVTRAVQASADMGKMLLQGQDGGEGK